MKRISFSLTIITVVLPIVASAASVTIVVDETSIALRDVQEGQWYAVAVKAAADVGIVSGYRDAAGKPTGLFGPADLVTIGQALKMAVTGAGYGAAAYLSDCDGGKCVTDAVLAKHWAAPYIAVAEIEKFDIQITAKNIDKRATRAEVAQIVADAFGSSVGGWMEPENILKDYKDVAKGHVYAEAIAAVTADDVMVGDGRSVHCATSQGCVQTTFRPDEWINRAEAVKVVMTARNIYGMPASPGGAAEPATPGEDVVVTYTDAGFAPNQVSVKMGTTVTFRNKSSSPMWVASDPHPNHNALPGFDAGKGYEPSEEYRYTFSETGTWGFHNHLQPSSKGFIIVLP